MRAGLCKDVVRSKEFVSEFLGGTCSSEELGLDECLAADRKVGSGLSLGISGCLITTLSIGNVFA